MAKTAPKGLQSRSTVVALLASAKQQPDDDVPRLVLADWLDERGDPRGEFVRVQCELTKLPKKDKRRTSLKQREKQLLKDHESAWLGPLREVLENEHSALTKYMRDAGEDSPTALPWEFRRGFLRIKINDSSFLSKPIQALAETEVWAWIDELNLFCKNEESTRRAAMSKLLTSICGLTVYGSKFGSGSAKTIANSPHLSKLTRLELSGQDIGPAGAVALAASPYLTRLTGLDLAHLHFLDANGKGISDKGIAALASSSNLAYLSTLILKGNSITHKGATAIASSPHLGKLKQLHLDDNPIGDAGASALANSPHLRALIVLTLQMWHCRDCAITDIGAEALATTPGLKNLKVLDLYWNNISPKWKRALKQRFGKGVSV